MSSKRQAAEARGRRAETLAAWMLRLKGYRIVATRLRTPLGEIDLVAKRGKLQMKLPDMKMANEQ